MNDSSKVGKPATGCPRCGNEGKPVKTVTLRSLLRREILDAAGNIEEPAWRFCPTPTCPAVYFDETGSTLFDKQALKVRVGIKETAAPRPVCYCFHHTVEEIEDDIARTGQTGVLDDIKTRMQEACWCETTSPMGSCCLGTVTRFIKAAQARAGDVPLASHPGDEEEERDCCAPVASQSEPAPSQYRGALATGGAVISAMLSSACCWLPLLLIAFGASAAGVAGFFEAWRPWFLAGAVLLLGAGFYFAYFRKADCAPGSACAVPNPRLRRFNRAMLWVAAVFVAAFALFPNYLGALLGNDGGDSANAATWTSAPNVISLPVEGMTCEACAISLEKHLAEVPGVARASVDYPDGRAVVLPSKETGPTSGALREAVEQSGYRVGK
ncbi:MAG: mercuric transporter MerT family protein [Verrucomicrobiales bacterium]